MKLTLELTFHSQFCRIKDLFVRQEPSCRITINSGAVVTDLTNNHLPMSNMAKLEKFVVLLVTLLGFATVLSRSDPIPASVRGQICEKCVDQTYYFQRAGIDYDVYRSMMLVMCDTYKPEEKIKCKALTNRFVDLLKEGETRKACIAVGRCEPN